MRRAFLVILGCILFQPLAAAEIYRWVDENGRIHLSDTAPQSDDAEQLEVEVNTYEPTDYSNIQYYQPEPRASRRKVVMYATSWCGFCAKARNYFQKKGIKYTEYDIDKNPQAREKFEGYGKGGVPLILVGSSKMRGFSVARFEKLYSGEKSGQ